MNDQGSVTYGLLMERYQQTFFHVTCTSPLPENQAKALQMVRDRRDQDTGAHGPLKVVQIHDGWTVIEDD